MSGLILGLLQNFNQFHGIFEIPFGCINHSDVSTFCLYRKKITGENPFFVQPSEAHRRLLVSKRNSQRDTRAPV